MDISFIKIARIIAEKSKDPSSKVGALIINKDKIISTGRNGFVAGNDESLMSFNRPLKYYLTIHAEVNAILYAKTDLVGTTMYVTHSPCSNCLKTILQTGIRLVYYETLYDKFDEVEKDAIMRLILSTDAKILNINGNMLIDELSLQMS